MEFTEEELKLLAIALTVQGVLVCGSYPRPEIMESLFLNKSAFLALTDKVVGATFGKRNGR